MDETLRRARMTGCYVTIPTVFRDDADLSLDLDAIGRQVHVAGVRAELRLPELIG